jgi:lysozyme family protein
MPDYPPEFVSAVDDLIDNWEGGYVDDPDDPGGETNMGISKRSYPKQDIKNLTRDRAIEIYYEDFWTAPKIDALPEEFRAKAFNMGVLLGTTTVHNLLAGCQTLQEFKDACVMHFKAIVIRHPVCAKYLGGWERRALA